MTAFMAATFTVDSFAVSDMHDNFNQLIKEEIDNAPSAVKKYCQGRGIALPDNISDEVIKRHFIATDQITVSYSGIDVRGWHVSYNKTHVFPTPHSLESILIARVADYLGVKALSTPRFCLKEGVPSTCDLIKFDAKKDCFNRESGRTEIIPCSLGVLRKPKHGISLPQEWNVQGLEEASALTYLLNPVGFYDYDETLFNFDTGDKLSFKNNHAEFYQQIRWRTELFTETNGLVGGSFQDYCIERFASLINRDSCDIKRFKGILYKFIYTSDEEIVRIVDEVTTLYHMLFAPDDTSIGKLMKKRFINTRESLERFSSLNSQDFSAQAYEESEL